MNRREALGATLAFPLLGGTGCSRPFFAAHGLPIGVQLYTLDPDLDRDFAGTLQALRRIGYRRVELAGLHGRSPDAVRAAFDAAGLECRSAHIQPVSPDGYSLADVDRLADAARAIGLTDIVLPIPLFPPDFHPPEGLDGGQAFRARGDAMTLADWQRTAAFLNEKGAALRGHGLRLSYHNHNFEFRPHEGGTTGLDVLLRTTDPALVHFEMDVGWVEAGGQDPIALLRAHPGRFTQMHVKDIKPSTRTNYEVRQDATEVGRGKIDWRRILPVAYAAGVRGFYVEQEPPYPSTRLASVGASYDYLAQLCTT